MSGRATGHRVEGNRVTFTYEGVNRSARLSVTWRFDQHGIWTEPVIYDTPTKEDIVSLHYFSSAAGAKTNTGASRDLPRCARNQ